MKAGRRRKKCGSKDGTQRNPPENVHMCVCTALWDRAVRVQLAESQVRRTSGGAGAASGGDTIGYACAGCERCAMTATGAQSCRCAATERSELACGIADCCAGCGAQQALITGVRLAWRQQACACCWCVLVQSASQGTIVPSISRISASAGQSRFIENILGHETTQTRKR
jgi:hypothetical protein